MAHEDTVQSLVKEIRVASERLQGGSKALCAELGLTSAERAVLETIAASGPRTVSQFARQKCVSRQHVQAIVDRLWERKLVLLRTNPDHLRSPLVELTEKGQALMETIVECEEEALAGLAPELTTDVGTALAVLRRLNAALARRAPF